MGDRKLKQDKLVKETATEISFRLLATSRHPDQKWLMEKLEEFANKFNEDDVYTQGLPNNSQGEDIDGVAIMGED